MRSYDNHRISDIMPGVNHNQSLSSIHTEMGVEGDMDILTPEEQLIEDERKLLDQQSNDITAAEQKRIDDDEAEQQAIEAAWQEEFDAQLLEDMVAGDELDGGSWYQGDDAHPDDYDFDRDHENTKPVYTTLSAKMTLGDLLRSHINKKYAPGDI